MIETYSPLEINQIIHLVRQSRSKTIRACFCFLNYYIFRVVPSKVEK
jgi:hypothetical protein